LSLKLLGHFNWNISCLHFMKRQRAWKCGPRACSALLGPPTRRSSLGHKQLFSSRWTDFYPTRGGGKGLQTHSMMPTDETLFRLRYWMYCMPLKWLWCASPVCLEALFELRWTWCLYINISFGFISAFDEGTEPGQQLSLQCQSPEHQWKSHWSVSQSYT